MNISYLLKEIYYGEVTEEEKFKKYSVLYNGIKAKIKIKNYEHNYDNIITSFYYNYENDTNPHTCLVLEFNNGLILLINFTFEDLSFTKLYMEEQNTEFSYKEYRFLNEDINPNDPLIKQILEDFYNFLLKNSKMRIKLLFNKENLFK